MSAARLAAVSLAPGHGFSKRPAAEATLLAGLGVEGDAHCGATVKHRSRVAANPHQPNLRQVHLLPAELLAELAAAGFPLAPGDLGENLLTEGLDLHALPTGARLRIGPEAVLILTGLRNPCHQIDDFRPGLLAHVLRRTPEGPERRGGVMATVETGGRVAPGDPVAVEMPADPRPLAPV